MILILLSLRVCNGHGGLRLAGMLDGVEQQFPHALKQQQADLLGGWFGTFVGFHLDSEVALLQQTVSKPFEAGNQTRLGEAPAGSIRLPVNGRLQLLLRGST